MSAHRRGKWTLLRIVDGNAAFLGNVRQPNGDIVTQYVRVNTEGIEDLEAFADNYFVYREPASMLTRFLRWFYPQFK